jgi:hypothetical protein
MLHFSTCKTRSNGRFSFSLNFPLLDSLRKKITADVQQVDPANSLSKCSDALPSAFENLLDTQCHRGSYNRMFSITAAKTCQKFEIPQAWSASMWLKLLNGWNSAVRAILTTRYIYPNHSRSHCPNTQARTWHVLPGPLLMETKNKTSIIYLPDLWILSQRTQVLLIFLVLEPIAFLLDQAYHDIYRRCFHPKQTYYQVLNLLPTQVKSMVFSNSTKV